MLTPKLRLPRRQVTKDLGTIAGLNALCILHHQRAPAATIAYAPASANRCLRSRWISFQRFSPSFNDSIFKVSATPADSGGAATASHDEICSFTM